MLAALAVVGQATLATGALGASSSTPYGVARVPSPVSQAEGRFGDRMKSAGDLNGDRVGDVWIGVYSYDVGSEQNVGRVYALSGRDRSLLYRIDSPEPQAQTTPGGFFGFGWSVSNLGDVDGDKVNDLVVGSVRHNVGAGGDGCRPGPGCKVGEGKAWVFSGAAGKQNRLLYELNNPESQAGGAFGWASRAGDVVRADGTRGHDGISEILVGAFQNDFPEPGCGNTTEVPSGCRKDQGQAFIFNGAPGVPAARRLVRTLDIPELDRYVNPATGSCVSPNPNPTGQACGALGIVNEGLGDVNGDGFWDQSVTAWTTGVTVPPAVDSPGRVCYGNPQQPRSPGDGCNERQGRIYVYSGRDGSLLHRIDDPEPQENALFGLQIVEAGAPGDVNRDGSADIYGNGFVQDTPQTSGPAEGRSWVFNGQDGRLLYRLTDPTPEPGGQFGYSLARTDHDKDGGPDLYIGSSPHHEPGSAQLGGTYVFRGRSGSLLRTFDLPPSDVQVGTVDNNGPQLGRSVAAPGDLNGDGEPDYLAGAPTIDVGSNRNEGRLYAFLSQGCGNPNAAGYLHPPKMRVSRARVLRQARRLDVLAPITSRADGKVTVMFHADDRIDTFGENVTEANTQLDEIRINKAIRRGQARLGTGIVNIHYLGDADTREQFVRLRAASRRAALDAERISLIGDRFSARGSVTSLANGIVRLRYSYVDQQGRLRVFVARAGIEDDGDWQLKNKQVPPQLARCGGYLSIQFTGYFPRRIRGEQLAYQLSPGQTRTP